MRVSIWFVPTAVIVFGCSQTRPRIAVDLSPADSTDGTQLQMRVPEDPYRMGPQRPEWNGSASVVGSGLQLEFPGIEPDNVGCAAVDSASTPFTREYYWLATAHYSDSHYPYNHFQQVVLRFAFGANAIPTRARLDSALRGQQLVVREAVGDPPMDIRRVAVERGSAVISPITFAGREVLRVRVTIEDADAIKAFLSPGVNLVSLGWCQRDQWLTSVEVPLEQRIEVRPQLLPNTR